MDKLEKNKNEKGTLSELENEKCRLVISRLSVLSPSTLISFGSEGSFSPSELIKKIEEGDAIGEKIVEIQMAWLQSFKEMASV